MALLALVAEVEVVLVLDENRAAAALGTLGWTGALAAGGRAPLAASALALVLLGSQALAVPGSVDATMSSFVGAFVCFWLAGSVDDRRLAVLGLAGAILAVFVIVLAGPDGSYGEAARVAVLMTAGWVVSVLVAARQRRHHEVEARAAELERVTHERIRGAAAEERARIARELHDVIAHSVGVMTVQAGAARMLVRQDPDAALAPLEAIERTGRDALAELRRLLGVLRDDARRADLAPQPGLAQLDALVATFRQAGLPVDITVEGDRRPLPPGLDLTAYRVVQEALTNAQKHGGGAHAHVTVRYADDALDLVVADDGRGGATGGGAGHGLVGMRERVGLYGGRLLAGPRAAGGYVVRAHLPLDAARVAEPAR